jgi:hypothetical protein
MRNRLAVVRKEDLRKKDVPGALPLDFLTDVRRKTVAPIHAEKFCEHLRGRLCVHRRETPSSTNAR